jgi:hypothetical protein
MPSAESRIVTNTLTKLPGCRDWVRIGEVADLIVADLKTAGAVISWPTRRAGREGCVKARCGHAPTGRDGPQRSAAQLMRYTIDRGVAWTCVVLSFGAGLMVGIALGALAVMTG